MMGCIRGRFTLVVSLVATLVAAVALGAASLAGANPTSKPYSLVISPGSPSYDSGTGVAPNGSTVGLLASGEAVTVTATFTNETKTQQLGSANLFWPAGFHVVGFPTSLAPPATEALASSCTYNGAQAGACVQLRGLAVPPGGSVTVMMTVTTPACQQGNGFGWLAEVKQANNYSGSPGNDLFLDPATSQPDTLLDGACSLQFVQQPADALTGQAITGSAFSPAGPSLAVEVLTGGGAVLPTSAAPVTLSPGVNPSGATIGGDTTASADGTTGIARFGGPPGGPTLSLPGIGDTLVASSGTLAAGSSNAFNVQDQAASCAANAPCSTKDGGTHTFAQLVTPTGGAGTLVESLFTNAATEQVVCAGYTSSDPNIYESAYTATSGADRSEVDTIQFAPVTKLKGTVQQILKAQQICFASKKQFETASGANAQLQTLPDGEQLYVGILPTCTRSNPGPCHNRQQDTTVADPSSPNGFDIVLVDDVPVGWADDPYRC